MDPGVLADLVASVTPFMDQTGFILMLSSVRQTGGGVSDLYVLRASSICCRTGITRRMPFEAVEGQEIASNKQYNWLFPVGTTIAETDILVIGPATWSGNYNPSTAYTVGEGVIVQGQSEWPSVWQCVANTTGNPPSSGSPYWQKAIMDEVEAQDRSSADIPALLVSCVNRV